MALMDKKRHGGRRAQRRMHKRRPKTGLYVFVGLVVVALGSLAYLGLGSASSGGSGSVERVQAPAAEEAPAAVSKKLADEARAKEQTASERAAEEGAQSQRAEEENAVAEEEAAAEECEAAVAPEDPTMYLTVPALDIDGVPVINDDSEAALEAGTQHVTSSGFPWQEGANTTSRVTGSDTRVRRATTFSTTCRCSVRAMRSRLRTPTVRSTTTPSPT